VEGSDDETFFSHILVPELKKKYDGVQIIQWARDSKKSINKVISSLNKMKRPYMFVTDRDNLPCLTKKKEHLKEKYNKIDINRILIVKIEIESWYLAGLDNKSCSELGIKEFSSTDNLIKEKFNELIPSGTLRTVFLSRILDRFSIETAKTKNSSFKYFFESDKFLGQEPLAKPMP